MWPRVNVSHVTPRLWIEEAYEDVKKGGSVDRGVNRGVDSSVIGRVHVEG